MTINEHWRDYRDKCFPDGMPALQNKELHRAFFVGAFAMLQEIKATHVMPEEEALAQLLKIHREVVDIVNSSVEAIKGRN